MNKFLHCAWKGHNKYYFISEADKLGNITWRILLKLIQTTKVKLKADYVTFKWLEVENTAKNPIQTK